MTVPFVRSQLHSLECGLLVILNRKCGSYNKLHGNITHKTAVFTAMYPKPQFHANVIYYQNLDFSTKFRHCRHTDINPLIKNLCMFYVFSS